MRDYDEKTPLHYASINCREDVFEFLVDYGADIDARDAVGATPLHFAVRWGSEAIVRYILRRKGSEAISVLDSGDRLGRTPLHYAASQKTGLSYISNLLKAGANMDMRDHSGMSPLHLACRFGNISLVRRLLDKGADKEARLFVEMSADIDTALILAAKQNNTDVTIWGTGSPLREFLHVDDLGEACVFAL